MSPNIMNKAKDPQEHDMCLQEDGDHEGGGPKPKVKPVETALERLYRMGYTRRALLIIAVLAALVLILLVTVIALAVRSCCASTDFGRPLCTEPDCYRTSAKVLQQINASVEPCGNFYEFACGGWLRDHSPIPRRYGDVGVKANAFRDYLVKSRETVETMPYTTNFRSLEWKVKAFYHSCMNLENIDGAGDTFLRRQIGSLGGWKPRKDWLKQNWDWAKVLRDLHSEHGISPFFSISVRPDDIHPYQNVIQISPSGLGLPHWSYYFRDPEDPIIKAYQDLMVELAKLLTVTANDADDFARDTFYFEKRIAESVKSEAMYGESKEKKKITLGELMQISQRIKWVDLIKTFLPKTYISEDTPVYLASRHYITQLSIILSSTDMEVLNYYMIWTLIFHYAPYLNRDYRKAVDDYSMAYFGAQETQPRWEFCIQTTNRIFGVALTLYYVKNHVSPSTLSDADTIFRQVRTTFANTVDEMKWLNTAAPSTTNKVNRVISTMEDEFVFRNEYLEDYYDMIEVQSTDFVQNIQNAAIFRRSQFQMAIANASRQYMHMGANENSSPYDSEFNRNVIAPVLLREPYIHSHYPKYMVFGALGSQFGRDLVSGLQETDDGIPLEGFTPVVWNNVTVPIEYQECLTSNYSQYKIAEWKIDGNKTLASNLADIGGLNQAYEAMIAWEDYNGLEPVLPGLTYTPEQLFFISYAQSMCSSMRPAYLDNFLHLSRSPPDEIRVLGAFTQVPQFKAAFGCQPVPNHCRLW